VTSVFFSNCSWEEGAEVPSATWTDDHPQFPPQGEKGAVFRTSLRTMRHLFERRTEIVSYSNLTTLSPHHWAIALPADETLPQRAVLCARRRRARFESKLIDEKLAQEKQENPHKTITVKEIPLGRYGRGVSACYIPLYVFYYYTATDQWTL
jgi:hypothetical protein